MVIRSLVAFTLALLWWLTGFPFSMPAGTALFGFASSDESDGPSSSA